MNGEKYRDPTADKAIRNVMKDSGYKHYLPEDLYRAVKTMESVLDLIGYKLDCALITDKVTGQGYIRGGEKK